MKFEKKQPLQALIQILIIIKKRCGPSVIIFIVFYCFLLFFIVLFFSMCQHF